MSALETLALCAFLYVWCSTIALWYAHAKLSEADRLADEDAHHASVKRIAAMPDRPLDGSLPDVAVSPTLADNYTPTEAEPVKVRTVILPPDVTAEFHQIVSTSYSPGSYGAPRVPARPSVPLTPRRVVWVNEQPRQPIEPPVWRQTELEV